MSTDVLEAMKRQAEALTKQEKQILADYLLTQTKDEGQKANKSSGANYPLKRQKSNAWLKANREAYGGLYVALDGDVLLGTGKNFVEAAKAAQTARVRDAFIDFVPPPDYVASMGGG
jgi:hypothetical protein